MHQLLPLKAVYKTHLIVSLFPRDIAFFSFYSHFWTHSVWYPPPPPPLIVLRLFTAISHGCSSPTYSTRLSVQLRALFTSRSWSFLGPNDLGVSFDFSILILDPRSPIEPFRRLLGSFSLIGSRPLFLQPLCLSSFSLTFVKLFESIFPVSITFGSLTSATTLRIRNYKKARDLGWVNLFMLDRLVYFFWNKEERTT